MSKSVAVPLHLLEDIFRLLIYLDGRSDHDDLHFQKTGYAPRFEHDNALWELRFKIRQLQGRIEEAYLLTVDDVTEDEKHDLRKWVSAGNSVYDNPFSLCDDSGCPMDYINGCRVGFEMIEGLSDFPGDGLDIADDDWGDGGEIPF